MANLILLDRTDGVATVTLNRPDRLNAFADDMRERLAEALETVARDADTRVLLVTGAGRAFCSGGDVHHMVELKRRGAPFEDLRPLLDAGRRVIERLVALPIPTVAAINGAAAGAGFNLALACDLRIASDRATFGETFARIGLHPDWGGSYHLPRLVGLARAHEMCWLADMIDAAEAERWGLVNRVVPHERLREEARTLAARLATAPRESVRLAKRTLRAALHRSLAECLDAEATAQACCWRSPDTAEGLLAFAEKREAQFGRRGPNGAGGSNGSANAGGAGPASGVESDSLDDLAPSPAARRFE